MYSLHSPSLLGHLENAKSMGDDLMVGGVEAELRGHRVNRTTRADGLRQIGRLFRLRLSPRARHGQKSCLGGNRGVSESEKAFEVGALLQIYAQG